MDIIIDETVDSLWASDCSSFHNVTESSSRDLFNILLMNDFDVVTALLVLGKLIVLCVLLYAVKRILYFAFWLFFLPFDWTKDLTDAGFYHIKSVSKGLKRDAVNRARRLRNVGDKLPPPYPNGWYGIAESKDVKCEQAININALGENFVVFRTNKGEIHILDAYCPHMGANLGVGGIVRGDCIECPFHQWKFRGSNGECIAVPYSRDGIVPKNSNIKTWPSCEINEAIFVFYHAEDVEPWRLPEIKEIETGYLIYQGRNEFLVNCHCQEIPENGADVAHLNAVHGPSMLTGSDIRFSRAEWATFTSHVWDANWEPGEEKSKHIATIELTHAIRLLDKFEVFALDVGVRQVGPGYVQLFLNSVFGPFIVLQTVVPVEPLVQKVIHRFYVRPYTAVFSKFLVWGESVMFERDMMVWNSKRYLESPRLMKEDRNIKAFRNWFQQFYTENSKTFTEAREAIEW